MDKTRCGCLNCRHQQIPTSHAGWKGLSNKHHHPFGVHQKGGHSRKLHQAH